MVDILQKRLQACLRRLKGLIVVQRHFFPLQRLEKAFCERILGWLARGRHADVGSDIEQARHIRIAAVLSPSVRVMDQPYWYLTLGQCHLQSLKRQLRIDATRQAPTDTFP